MNLFLQFLNGNVDAAATSALLFVWGVQIIAIVGITLIVNRSQAGSN